ncbi:hypothetical protein N007_07315 [Alicyclobacillus acidoterrestris ATCC 49025]|nr:hypothetical protein N007_07315 [Alicyclobacillus acidoterrestris ATCC 49025]
MTVKRQNKQVVGAQAPIETDARLKITPSWEIPPAPTHPGLRGAFQVRPIPYPWRRATRAAISMGLTLIAGSLIGNMSLAMVTSMGAFTAIYAGNEPYAQRAVKCAMVAVGLALAIGLGTALAGSVLGIAVALCIVSAGATFLCGAWRVPVPSAYFFILVGAVGTGMPIAPHTALLRAGCVLLGGAIAWVVSMAGWLVNPHGPESRAVAGAYRALANFLSAVGTVSHDSARHQATVALQNAQVAVTSGELQWRKTAQAYRLYLLTQKANIIFLCGVQLAAEKKPICQGLADAVRNLGASVSNMDLAGRIRIPSPTCDTEVRRHLARHLEECVHIAGHLTQVPETWKAEVQRNPSLLDDIRVAWSRASLVRPATLRIGVAVLVSVFVAWVLGDPRPYWVPLTCASVLQGATVLASVHRTLQRALGTTVGILIAGGILWLRPTIALAVVAIVALQLIVELLVGRNYGAAVVFITPLPILLIELGQWGVSPVSVIEARFFDTVVGCVIGLWASLTLWRRAASTRVRPAVARVIRAIRDVLRTADEDPHIPLTEQRASRRSLESALVHLRMVHDQAVNEYPRQNAELEKLWPVVVSAQRLGYLVLSMNVSRQPMEALASSTVDTVLSRLAQMAETGSEHEIRLPETLFEHPTWTEQVHVMCEGLLAAANRH